MGRQIIFYMDKADEEKFCTELQKYGDILLRSDDSLKYSAIEKFPEKGESKYWDELCFYNKKFGNINYTNGVFTFNNKPYVLINQYSSPVIEISRSSIDHQSKKIYRGRIYYIGDYFNEEEQLIRKDEGLTDIYKCLYRWIRKNLKYMSFENHSSKEYVSDSMIDLVNNGYKLL